MASVAWGEKIDDPLPIVDAEAHRAFRETARRAGKDPDHFSLAHYVDFEWHRSRHLFESELCPVRGRRVLEFGCNVGATATVLGLLGAEVSGIDVNPDFVELARLNSARYGVLTTTFQHVPDTRSLPFGDAAFDVVTCNSVLEYVPHRDLPDVQREIDRVLAPGGTLVILGTSSRLYPREMHSSRWGVNYVPRIVDRLTGRTFARGVAPWTLRRGFGPGYEDLGVRDGGRTLCDVRARMGLGGAGKHARALARSLSPLGVSLGMLTPAISMVLRKRGAL